MLSTSGASAGGGMISSSALLFVAVGLLALLLTHRGISGWVSSRQVAVREHLYGPEELYAPVTADQQDPGVSSEHEGGDVEPDDGFDYSIFATDPPSSQ